MPPHKQKVWLEEMENPQLETARGLKNRRFTTCGSIVPEDHWEKEY